MSSSSRRESVLKEVLILVVMEYTQWDYNQENQDDL